MTDIYTLDDFTFNAVKDLNTESVKELSNGLEDGEDPRDIREFEGRSSSSTSSSSSGYISGLVSHTAISPNKSVRTAKIEGITIHHMAGALTIEQCGQIFAPTSRKASSNYGVGSDGRIACYVPENYRAWTSSSSANDNRCVTIEVANSYVGDPWPVSDAAYEALIRLCADICIRNGIKALIYTGNTSGNLTMHQWFASTACIPTDSEVLTHGGWVPISEIDYGEEIACADLDNLRITFEEVYNKVPIKKQDVYENNGLTATKDHRMVYRTQSNMAFRINDYAHLLREGQQIYIPMAGHYDGEGLDISDDMLSFLIAVQADGHYMYEITADGSRHYYGVEFHFSKPRKIERMKDLLDRLELNYSETLQSNKTVKLRIYNQNEINIVEDFCEQWLENKCFTWSWIELSPEQADLFLNEIMLWDGCSSGKKYSSMKKINLDIVSAISALNGKGSRVVGSDVHFRDNPYITLGDSSRRKTQKSVTCVTVKTGLFLMRQKGKTFIVGNCPGPYLKERFPAIAKEVTKRVQAGTIYEVVEKEEEPAVTKAEVQVMIDDAKKDLIEAVKLMLTGEHLPASDWILKNGELEEAKAAGITDGQRPQGYAKREEVAAMVLRALKKS